jgi:hypothetical protein
MSNTITPTFFYCTLNVRDLEIFYREAGPRAGILRITEDVHTVSRNASKTKPATYRPSVTHFCLIFGAQSA